MKMLAIAGSLRAQSSNAALVQAISQLAPESTTFKIYTDLASLPPFSPDIDTEASPQPVIDLRTQIDSADAVLICTPEYAYGMPGVLKNMLDWPVSSGSLYKKSVAAISASPSGRGGDRALEWLLQTLMALGAKVPAEASFLVPFVKEKVENQQIIDERIANRVHAMFAALTQAME